MKKLDEAIIFHVGNVANNAYNAAAIERKLGLKSFAISPDYLHVMAFPFWEKEEIIADPDATFLPAKYLERYGKPDWFLMGNWHEIYGQLISLLNKESYDPLLKIEEECYLKRTRRAVISQLLKYGRTPLKRILPNRIRHWVSNSLLVLLRRENKLDYSRVFDLADIVVFYGAYNAFATISNWNSPYISVEHGTLRDYIKSDFYLAKKSSDAYKNSFRTMITNQDCFQSAIDLGIDSAKIIKTPHPSSDFDFTDLRKTRLSLLKMGLTDILCPARHSYGSSVDRGKGNQIAIEAIFKALEKFPRLSATFVEWGDDVEKSKRIIQELGLDERVKWVGVLSRRSLKLRMIESLVVLDQFKIPAYGGVTSDALGLGVPVITLQDSALDVSFFGSPAPVMTAENSGEIFEKIIELESNLKLQQEYFCEATEWYDANLSSSIAFERRKRAYIDQLTSSGVHI